MKTIPQLGAMTIAAALVAVPVLAPQVFAQNAPTNTPAARVPAGTAPGSTAMTAPAPGAAPAATAPAGTVGNVPVTTGATSPNALNANAPATPAEKNPVLTDDGQVRASKVIGSSVYNDHNEKIGSVDDILMGKDNQPATAVISVGGFLGIGSKLVSVPYDKLQFGDTSSQNGNRVVMPGASKDALNGMPDYHYTKTS